MSRLDAIHDALLALAVCLQPHGPACVCAACQAYHAAITFLPLLGHLFGVLKAWERGEAEEPVLPEDIGRLLQMVGEDEL